MHKEGDRYEAVADLTIKSNTHEVTLPFTWTRQGDSARIEGKATAIMQGQGPRAKGQGPRAKGQGPRAKGQGHGWCRAEALASGAWGVIFYP